MECTQQVFKLFLLTPFPLPAKRLKLRAITDGDEEAMGEIHFDFTNGAVAFATYLLDELKENPKTLPELLKSLEQMVGDALVNNLILSQTEIFEA